MSAVIGYDWLSHQYIILHRIQPSTQEGYILIAHTAFSKDKKDRGYGGCPTLYVISI